MNLQTNCGYAYGAAESAISCMICTKDVPPTENPLYQDYVTEILSDLFEVLCKCLEWSPPSKYQFDFNVESFPFCKECKLSVVSLYKLHEQLEEIDGKINRVTLVLQGKILESHDDRKILGENECTFTSNAKGHKQKSSKVLGTDEKCSYYREAILTRFTPLVQLGDLFGAATIPTGRSQPDVFKETLSEHSISSQQIPVALATDVRISTSVENNSCGIMRKELDQCYNPEVAAPDVPGPSSLEHCFDNEESTDCEIDESQWSCVFCGGDFPTKLHFIRHLDFCRNSSLSVVNADENQNNSHQINQTQEPERFHANSPEPVASESFLPEQPALTSFTMDKNVLTTLTSEHSETLITFLRQQENKLLKNLETVEAGHFTFLFRGKYHFGRRDSSISWCCIFCNSTFRRRNHLILHLKCCPYFPPADGDEEFKFNQFTYDRLRNQEFQCRHCKLVTPLKEEMINHLQSFHGNRGLKNYRPVVDPFNCAMCGKRFSNQANLDRHKYKVHNLSKGPANEIGGIYSFRCNTEESLKEAQERKKFNISRPNVKKTPLGLHKKAHRQKTDKRARKLNPCDSCGKEYSQKRSLDLHKCKLKASEPLPDKGVVENGVETFHSEDKNTDSKAKAREKTKWKLRKQIINRRTLKMYLVRMSPKKAGTQKMQA